ncbi:hypothetical protein DWB85_06030 [Seongchinamella sediminis]|uniref:Multidrug efflux pump subunit AcrA (Membrane-fusion protein) n=1 Tax=Seongchinamella sediminis TaxID=2283635 RepID=A0A3L7DZ59_9GAMM|nr:hypothetical protein [Seongchinamella sediminis]RLQ22544.1 hypothetical protein DWB85_06030 [Seongchinamella sediminis]
MRVTLLLALLAWTLPTLAQSVATASLGALELSYEQVSAGDGFAGLPLAAEVTFRPGEAISLVTLARIQRINYLVAPGEKVTPGQLIAEMSGPEIHHFLTEYEVVAERYERARQRFDRNQKLYRTQAIDEARWIEISDSYYALQLEYEHLGHFRALLRPQGEDHAPISLVAPAAGRLQYTQGQPGIAQGDELALILPPQSLRLRVAVPIAGRHGLARLHHGACELPVESISKIADGFFLWAWSAPLEADCELLPGEQLMVTPYYAIEGYDIPRQALLHWNDRAAVLLRRDEQLQLVPVEVLGSTPAGYYVQSESALAGNEILITSVSAVQGILLGLGGE